MAFMTASDHFRYPGPYYDDDQGAALLETRRMYS